MLLRPVLICPKRSSGAKVCSAAVGAGKGDEGKGIMAICVIYVTQYQVTGDDGEGRTDGMGDGRKTKSAGQTRGPAELGCVVREVY